MSGRYSEPVDWAGAGWALAVWAAHFTVLWSASSIFPAQAAARWIALAATLAAAAALAAVWRWRRIPGLASVPGIAAALAALATGFGALPAAIG